MQKHNATKSGDMSAINFFSKQLCTRGIVFETFVYYCCSRAWS